ncbi:GNAT family N-acetyltransferase [Nonomuraea guangzhouensis]|uniref:GNAT family N-acetyltransferase n=1 Tax=Nonomuraea guangzhouensis TaxID=1291555 RepID=A0ABW4G9X8_9ACTN|nr:GNAT family N-acetyltransferase [Nonomuraea guangzhouensis]
MVEIHPATPDLVNMWRLDWENRLHARYEGWGYRADDIAEAVETSVVRWRDAADSALFAIMANGRAVGFVAVEAAAGEGFVHDIWIAETDRGQGYGTTALKHAENWCADRGVKVLNAGLNGSDPAHVALFRDYSVHVQTMTKTIGACPSPADGPLDRKPRADEFRIWLEREAVAYGKSLESEGLSPQEARDVARLALDRELPEGVDTPGHSFHVIESEGEAIAAIWIQLDRWAGRAFVFSVWVEEACRGHGYGHALMRVGERVAARHGNHLLALNVFPANESAVQLYATLDYRVEEQIRGKVLSGQDCGMPAEAL